VKVYPSAEALFPSGTDPRDLLGSVGGQVVLDRFHVTAAHVPVLICRGATVPWNPGNQQIADCLGFNDAIDRTSVRDLVVVGAGPAGLAAAVYGASEGWMYSSSNRTCREGRPARAPE
jgi:NADPH-dependent 2,4-dienoyl-CoA reductase/sulfur reductase-like enzyme